MIRGGRSQFYEFSLSLEIWLFVDCKREKNKNCLEFSYSFWKLPEYQRNLEIFQRIWNFLDSIKNFQTICNLFYICKPTPFYTVYLGGLQACLNAKRDGYIYGVGYLEVN